MAEAARRPAEPRAVRGRSRREWCPPLQCQRTGPHTQSFCVRAGSDRPLCQLALNVLSRLDESGDMTADRIAQATRWRRHDGHMAMVLGAASALAADIAFDGTVHLVFQPAEESGTGAAVPDRVIIRGDARTFTDADSELVEARIREIAEGAALVAARLSEGNRS